MVGTADKAADNSTLLAGRRSCRASARAPKPSGAVKIGGGDVQAYRYNDARAQGLRPRRDRLRGADLGRRGDASPAWRRRPTPTRSPRPATRSPTRSSSARATRSRSARARTTPRTVSKALGTLGKADKSGQAKLKCGQDAAGAGRGRALAEQRVPQGRQDARRRRTSARPTAASTTCWSRRCARRAGRTTRPPRRRRRRTSRRSARPATTSRRAARPSRARSPASRPPDTTWPPSHRTTRTERHRNMQPRQIGIIARRGGRRLRRRLRHRQGLGRRLRRRRREGRQGQRRRHRGRSSSPRRRSP